MCADINIYSWIFYCPISRFPNLSRVPLYCIPHPIILENCMPYITSLNIYPSITPTTYKIWGKYRTRFSKLEEFECSLDHDIDSQTNEDIGVSADDFTVVVQSILNWFPQVVMVYKIFAMV